MLVDEVDIEVKAGNGGSGFVHFLSNRHQPKGGPDGGDGGDGGSVYAEGVADITRLKNLSLTKKYAAPDGQVGGAKQKTGHNGDDLILKLPVGTVISYDNGTQIEIFRVGEMAMIAKGGKGGGGNYRFRSPINTTPRTAKPGEIKPWRRLHLELKLIAHVGLVGLPNAGKSSLLNVLTRAQAKVANYPFTTLEPNLGVMAGGYIIADIPGLIEGASSGKGLGAKFLRHIERTQVLLHCLSSESSNLAADYQTIRTELSNFSSKLANKPEIIIITKSDLNPQAKFELSHLSTSIHDSESLKSLTSLLVSKLRLS